MRCSFAIRNFSFYPLLSLLFLVGTSFWLPALIFLISSSSNCFSQGHPALGQGLSLPLSWGPAHHSPTPVPAPITSGLHPVPSSLLGALPSLPLHLLPSLLGYTLLATGLSFDQSRKMFICGFQASDIFTITFSILKPVLRSTREGVVTWYLEWHPGGWCDMAKVCPVPVSPQPRSPNSWLCVCSLASRSRCPLSSASWRLECQMSNDKALLSPLPPFYSPNEVQFCHSKRCSHLCEW